jgi:hypothetical protein
MTITDGINLLALPAGICTLGCVGWVSAHAAAYLRERTHNERLARLADGVARIAGEVQGKLLAMPPGSDLAAVKATALAAGISDARVRFETTIASLGGTDDADLAGMIAGELGKLTASAATLAAPLALPLRTTTGATP